MRSAQEPFFPRTKKLDTVGARVGACHFGPLQSLPWPLGHVRLISFLGLVCADLLFSLHVSHLIPAPRGLSQKGSQGRCGGSLLGGA